MCAVIKNKVLMSTATTKEEIDVVKFAPDKYNILFEKSL
jgi:hypothetical protein